MTVTPRTSTCAAWALPTDITEVDYTTLDADVLGQCLQAASDVLYDLSGRQFSGLCTDTVRPQPRIINRDHGRPIASPVAWWNGNGWGYYTGGYLYGYGYSRWGWITTNREELPDRATIPSVDLGVFPLVGVSTVLIDGQVIDPTTYRIDDNRHLVRVINPAIATSNPGWPLVQNMELPTTEANTWQVTFTYGVAPPPMGVMACAELAYQLYLAVTPAVTGVTKLPARITQIARQGVSAVVLDPQVFLDKGLTGLIRCDMFLRAKNPAGLRRRATVQNTDIKRRVRRTGSAAGGTFGVGAFDSGTVGG